MEDMQSMACKSAPTLWQAASWYRATTLRERVALRSTHCGEPSLALCSPLPTPTEQRLRLWKEQAAFKKSPSLFAHRLGQEGLSEAELLTLLAEPMEVLQARQPASPEWLLTLARTLDQQETAEAFDVPPPDMEKYPRDIIFLNIVKPLLWEGWSRLQAAIEQLTRQYPQLPFDPNTILTLLFARLPRQVVPQLSRTFALELNVARVQGRLQGESPEERFAWFAQHLSHAEGLLALLEEYPVLARSLVETVERWLRCEISFVQRLCADWAQICDRFPPAQKSGVLTDIDAEAGDTHRGGHSVKLLTWSSGFRLVYKPRDLSIDEHFQEVLSWLNAHGQQPVLRTFAIFNRGNYGWTEFVPTQPCESAEAVERFYQRQGAYLALLHTLQATDFHYENVIASGEHPTLIDLETLFCPRVHTDDIIVDTESDAFFHSVLRVGLLPIRIWSNKNAEGFESSALGGHDGQFTPMAVPQWKERGTDQMRLARERVEIPSKSNHRPTLNGQGVDTLAYTDHIVTGFAATYRRLLDHRDELLTQVLPRFAQDQTRCLLRPTQSYALLLDESFHPNVLRDALDRDRLLDYLWLNSERQPHLSRVIPAEQRDLLGGDIPLFSSSPNSRDMLTSRGDRIPDFFQEASLESVKKRVQQLDDLDMKKQIWTIQASFTSLVSESDRPTGRRLELHPSHIKNTSQQLLAQARAAGDRLYELASHLEETVTWLAVVSSNEHDWNLIPVMFDLYNGTSGIALFLAYLGHLTGEEHYSRLAQGALHTIRSQVARAHERPLLGGISGFGGIGSVIYLLSHLGSLWQDASLYQEAEQLVSWLPALIEHDELFDVLGGSAGGIGALLSLYQVAPSALTLTTAIHCGERLLAAAQPMKTGVGWPTQQHEVPLAGMAHGNAGIALNLLRLGAVSQQDRFRRTACAAIEYERSIFSSEHHNWPDLRPPRANTTPTQQQEQTYKVAWCHGAPGIGLARLESRQYIEEDGSMDSEIATAIETTLTHGFGMNHSLCHGDMGNLELLHLAAAQHRLPAEQQEQLAQIVAMLLDSVQTQGWVSGIPMKVETPGLMLGLAGTGYALLRLAAPERVPSVLILAPPC